MSDQLLVVLALADIFLVGVFAFLYAGDLEAKLTSRKNGVIGDEI